MTNPVADRVWETATTTGTGAFSLGGAKTGYQAFSSAFSTGNTVHYCIVLQGGTDWEVGLGTLATGSPWTLTRTTVLASTNSNAAVNFGAGTKDVFHTVPASVLTLVQSSVQTSRQVIAGTGLGGGGDLSADRTLTANVQTVFGRTGAVAAAAGDYTLAQLYNAVLTPQGRVTLTSGAPVMSATATGQTTVYYSPYVGQFVPIYDGTRFVMTDTGGELSQATTDTAKSPAAVAQESAYDVFAWNDSGTIRATRGPAWTTSLTGPAGTVAPVASPGVVNWTAHGIAEGQPVVFTTSGALPTGLVSGTTYYVGRSPAANTFNVSTSIANAAAGTFINFTGSTSGNTTVTNQDLVRGTGAGTTEITRLNGIWVNANNITNGPAANRGTLLGSIRSNASNQIDFIFGGSAAGGTAAVFGVFNVYNRVGYCTVVNDSTASWTFSSATAGALDGSVANRVSWINGISETMAAITVFAPITTAATIGALAYIGIGLNVTSVFTKKAIVEAAATGASTQITASCSSNYRPGLGWRYIQALQGGDGTTTTTISASGTIDGLIVSNLNI